MSPVITLVLLALVAVILAVAALIVVNGLRSRTSLSRSLDMQLLLFLLPRFAAEGGEKDERKLIAVMEQLYASVANLKIKGWNKFLFGDPYLVLEMAVHHIGEQIHFYAAVPSKFADQFEKQMVGVFPTATVQRSPDYNIFNPQGGSAGAYLTQREDPILPVLTYTELPSDPLGPLVSAMGRIEKEGEGVAIQIAVRPSSHAGIRKLASDTARQMQAGNDFHKALKLAQHPPKKDEKRDSDAALKEPPKVATEFEQKLITALQSKASRPLFDCNIRILASSSSPERADAIMNDVAGAFSQYTTADRNGFNVKKLSGKALERLEFEFAFRLFDDAQTVTLSAEELTSVYHFPTGMAVMPKVKFVNFKTAEPPPGLPEHGIAFGMNEYRGQSTLLRIAREDRRRHMYIIGQTGTGKTVTMQSMIPQDLESGDGITVLDPHGSFAEWVLANVPKERIDDVIYFNPGDTSFPLGLNMLEFDPSNPQDKTLIIDELFEIMSKLYDLKETGGPMFERYFKNATYLLLDNYERRVPTLADMSRVFVDEAFRNDLLAHESNTVVKQFWELEATKMTGDQSLANFAGYVTSKIDTFTSNDFLRPIVNQQTSVIDFRDVIENRKILICNLSKGKIGDMNANLLGMVITGKLRRAALARDTKRADLPDHYLYMDEFQNFTTDSISVILAEARKYRLCLIMAHQFIKQLDDAIRDSVFGNVGTMVVYRVSPEDAEMPLLKTKFEPVFSPYDVSNIDNFHAYVSMLVNSQVARPTSMRGLAEIGLAKGDPAVRDAIIESSHAKFGRPREEVESEIRQRFERTT
ncbi:MAG TPA: type IV secretion system DNA-binding domain-containing protein [Candidatus Paceibacterota bacterium]|nr:type IV secretion system DNA-binding domain-containing protein [Candidatus Paceibacterota bacterium]